MMNYNTYLLRLCVWNIVVVFVVSFNIDKGEGEVEYLLADNNRSEGAGTSNKEQPGRKSCGNTSTVECPVTQQKLDIIFVLDGSGSVSRNFGDIKIWTENMASKFDIQKGINQIGVVQFSSYQRGRSLDRQDRIRTEVSLGQYKTNSALSNAIRMIRHTGGLTYTAHAMNKTVGDFKNGSRWSDKNTQKVMIILTDGRATDSRYLPSTSSYVRSLGIITFAVGVGSYNRNELRIIATGNATSDERVLAVNTFSGLESIVKDLSNQILNIVLEDVRNECSDSNICNGHGSCQDYVHGYRCDCNTYYHGTRCEYYNECLLSDNLCRIYGGTCVDLTDGYKCTNCPVGQHGDKCQYKQNPCKVTCSTSSMTAECDTRFMNEKMKTIPIFFIDKTAVCRLPRPSGYFRRLTIPYSMCGTKIDYKDDYVIYRNELSVGDPKLIQKDSDSIITRAVGHFSFKMECTLSLVRNASAAALNDLSLPLNETMDLQDHKNIDVSGTNIGFYKSNYSTRISSYIVGDRLYAKVTINPNNNPTLERGYILHLVSCFATPESSKDGEQYELLRDGSLVDETFRFEREASETAYFSFDSFSFKSNPGKLYLHCSSIACIGPKMKYGENCGANCDEESSNLQTTSAPFHPKIIINDTITRAPGSTVKIFPTSPSSPDEQG